MNKKQLIIVTIIVSALAVRIAKISQPLLEFFPQRQTQTAEITRNIYINGWPDFWTSKIRYLTNGKPTSYVLEFPLYNGIVAVLYNLFGPNLIWGRIASLTFFVGSSLIFFKILESAASAKPGIITNNQQLITNFALLFFVFSPLHILISRSFQPDELVLFLLLFAIYKKSWLIFSLAILTKLPVAIFAPIMLYRSSLSRNNFIKLALSIIPPLTWYYRAGKLTIHPAIARNFDLSNWFQPQLWLQPNWYFSLFQIEQIWVLTTLGLLFFWIGFWGKISKKRIDLWLIWLANGILYLTLFNYHAMTHEYYHLLLLPPLSIFVGLGLSKILETTKEFSKNIQTLSTIGIILLFILGLIQPAIRKIISAPKSPEESEEINANRYRLIEEF